MLLVKQDNHFKNIMESGFVATCTVQPLKTSKVGKVADVVSSNAENKQDSDAFDFDVNASDNDDASAAGDIIREHERRSKSHKMTNRKRKSSAGGDFTAEANRRRDTNLYVQEMNVQERGYDFEDAFETSDGDEDANNTTHDRDRFLMQLEQNSNLVGDAREMKTADLTWTKNAFEEDELTGRYTSNSSIDVNGRSTSSDEWWHESNNFNNEAMSWKSGNKYISSSASNSARNSVSSSANRSASSSEWRSERSKSWSSSRSSSASSSSRSSSSSGANRRSSSSSSRSASSSSIINVTRSASMSVSKSAMNNATSSAKRSSSGRKESYKANSSSSTSNSSSNITESSTDVIIMSGSTSAGTETDERVVGEADDFDNTEAWVDSQGIELDFSDSSSTSSSFGTASTNEEKGHVSSDKESSTTSRQTVRGHDTSANKRSSSPDIAPKRTTFGANEIRTFSASDHLSGGERVVQVRTPKPERDWSAAKQPRCPHDYSQGR